MSAKRGIRHPAVKSYQKNFLEKNHESTHKKTKTLGVAQFHMSTLQFSAHPNVQSRFQIANKMPRLQITSQGIISQVLIVGY